MIFIKQTQPQGQPRRVAPTAGSVTMNPGFDFPIFGLVENGVMVLNDKFSHIKIDEYIVMPDHIHAIITINDTSNRVGADLRVCPCTTNIPLNTIIQWFKTMTTNEYTTNVKIINWRPFHKNYGNAIIMNV
jgi:hypothetical protein